ncbi:MAG TPA: hypothetical protein DCO86_01110 [Spirochaetaceae bacterium]|nr:hypothetical protein [Spirochaetaceae bacterium]
MTVRRIMNANPITTTPDASIVDVQQVLKDNKIHRLPVLDRKGALAGVITEKDILHATPSPVSSLSIYEIPYMLAKLKVSNLMSKPKSVSPDTLVEEAARMMIEGDLSCLPVVEGGRLIGIVSKSDMFKVLVELCGANEKGVRATVILTERKGELAKLTGALTEQGFDIVSMGTVPDSDRKEGVLTIFKVRGDKLDDVLSAIKPLVREIVDIRLT